MLEEGEDSVLCIPVVYKNEVEAVIKAVNHGEGTNFDLDDLDLLVMLGKYTGLLIHQSHILKDAMSAARLADATGRLIKSATSPWATIEDIIEEVKADCQRLVPSEVVTIFFLDYVRKELWGVLNENKKEGKDDIFRLNFGLGLAGQAAAENRTIVTGDAYQEEGFYKDSDQETGFKTRSMISIPIMGPNPGNIGSNISTTQSDTVVAVLQIINKQDAEKNVIQFDKDDVVMLSNYASKVSAVLRTKMQAFKKQKLEADVQHSPKDETSRTMLAIAKEYTTNTIAKSVPSNGRHSALRSLSARILTTGSSKR